MMMLSPLKFNSNSQYSFKSQNNVIAFRGEIKSADNPLAIQDQFISSDSKSKTVTILGSSRDADSIKGSVAKAFDIARTLVNRGYNVLTGCGDKGIMGAAYKGASSAEKDPEAPEHNLAVLVNPLWGDEDTKHCKVISKAAASEADRIENGFLKASNSFLVFPGGACSIQEASTLIAKNKYRPKNAPPLKIMLVGKDYYRGLKQQYEDMEKAGILGGKAEDLFTVVDPEDVLKEFPDLQH